MKIIPFYISYFLVSVSASMKTEMDDAKSLTSCVVKLIEEIDYKKYSTSMDITVMNINNDLKLSALHKIEGARFVTRRFFWDPGNIGNVIYILMSEDYGELEHGLSKVISDKFWNPSARFIIVLQSFENYSLRDITNLLHVYNIFYKVSLISRHGNEYSIYKYNFTKPDNCLKSGHLTFWSKCSDYQTKMNLPVLYKGSIRNCRYTFVTRNFWPFTNFDSSAKGSEQNFLSLFEKQYGVKIDLHEFGKVDKYGKLMDNSSIIMLQKVVNNEYEGAVGGYAINSENNHGNISYSYPMLIDHMFYIVAHSNYVEQWVAVLYKSPYTFIVIILLFVIFCVMVTFLSIFRAQNDVSFNILIVFGYLLNKNYVKRIESGWSQTLIFSSLLFTALIIPYAIQADLFSVTTQPIRGYEPKEPEDLWNYQAILCTDWQFRKEFAGHWDCETRLSCLMMVKNYPQLSLYTIISDTHYSIYQWQLADTQCKMETYRLKDPYISIYRTIFLRRGSVLIPYLDTFALRISSIGVPNKIATGIYFREWLKCKSLYSDEHMPLPLSNFYYVFMILIGGYCLSLGFFIYEVWAGTRHNIHV